MRRCFLSRVWVGLVGGVLLSCAGDLSPSAAPATVEVASGPAVGNVSAPLLYDDNGLVYVCYPRMWGYGYWLLRVPPDWVETYLSFGAHLPAEGLSFDQDGDGYGDSSRPVISCYEDALHVPQAGDCNDWLPEVSPQAQEQCNLLDDDCDARVDEGCEGVPEQGRGAVGVCLCGWPELTCSVDGQPGPACKSASDCGQWCTAGLPTCAPGPGEQPPECEGEADCFFVEETCPPEPEPDGVCLCGWPELYCTVEGEPGPACADAEDCGQWCTDGLPTCAPGLGELPPECEGEAGCFFVEESCSPES